MKRRTFITGLLSALATPFVAKAQGPVKEENYIIKNAPELRDRNHLVRAVTVDGNCVVTDDTIEFNMISNRGAGKTNAAFDHAWKGEFPFERRPKLDDRSKYMAKVLDNIMQKRE